MGRRNEDDEMEYEDPFDSAGNQPISYGPTDGSKSGVDAAYDAHAVDFESYSENETYIPLEDVPQEQIERFRELKARDEGRKTTEYKQRKANADRIREARTFCNYIELTSHETERVCTLIEETDYKELGNPPSELVALCFMTLVFNKQRDKDLREWSAFDHTDFSPRFTELVESFEYDAQDIRNIRARLRTEL